MSVRERPPASRTGHAPRGALASGGRLGTFRSVSGWWRWAALPFGIVYLVLLAAQFRGVITTTNLDADAVSAPVIGELFGSAGPHASVVLGTFGWYASLLFELATKWLPLHRQVWELAPYAMALAGAALVAWSVWQIAGRWAASLAAVLLICAAPDTLHLLLSMTQHAPDWFCCALLGAFLVLIERRVLSVRPPLLVAITVAVGVIVGINAASDTLVTIAALVPFVLAVLAGFVAVRGPSSVRAIRVALAMLVIVAISWVITDAVMSSLSVGPEPGLDTTRLATGGEIGTNFRLWWQSVAVLGNGEFLGRNVSFTSALAVACAVLSITAVVLLPRFGWREFRARITGTERVTAPERLAFVVFWSTSAVLLTAAFLLSALPVDIHADRYLAGLVYAAAALVPVLAAGRSLTEGAALLGTCVFALGGITSMAQRTSTRNTAHFPTPSLAKEIAAIAASQHLKYGYAGYWDAAPITWSTRLRVQVYPVSICDQNGHLCRFDLHYISSWYTPRDGIRSFLLIDPALPLLTAPTPDLGRPVASYHVGRITMYVYPYDLAKRLRVT